MNRILRPAERHRRGPEFRVSFVPRSRWVVGLVLCLLTVPSTCRAETGDTASRDTSPLPEGVPRLQLTGELSSFAQVRVFSRVAGVVSEVRFQDGDSFSKNDIIATIDPTEYVIAAREAQADLDDAHAKLEAMKAGGRPEEIRRAEAALAAADAVLGNSKQNQERIAGLFERGSVTHQDFDASTRELAVARSERLSAEKTLELVRAGPRAEERQQAVAMVHRAQARVDLATLHVEYTKVRAPFDGGIGRRLIDEGAYVLAASSPQAPPICIFANSKILKAVLDIPEKDLPYVRVGHRAWIRVQAMPGIWIEGKVTNLYAFVDSQTRMGKLELQISNDPLRLISGMFVTAIIEIADRPARTADEILGRVRSPTASPTGPVSERAPDAAPSSIDQPEPPPELPISRD